ncbi:hypothetical protein DAI22_09g028266 [Oryza sativa Japonica Group]|nr:hypothetical protein DAI22_09g028266 [Oryza sativa Japonica Group]
MRLLLLSRSVARLSRCSSTLQPNSPVSRCLCSASQPLSGEMLHSRRHLHHLSRLMEFWNRWIIVWILLAALFMILVQQCMHQHT